MKMLIATLLSVWLMGCGGGDQQTPSSPQSSTSSPQPSVASCAINTAQLTNGASASALDSYWACKNATGTIAFAIYDDGTGESTAIGPFTWEETGCGQYRISGSAGLITVDQVQGSLSSGIFTFRETYSNGVRVTEACKIVTL